MKDELHFEFRDDPLEGPSLWVDGRCFVRGMRYDETIAVGGDGGRWDERVYRTLRRGLSLVAAQDKRIKVTGGVS